MLDKFALFVISVMYILILKRCQDHFRNITRVSDSNRRLVRSNLGSNCLQGLLATIIFVSFFETNIQDRSYLLKLYAMVLISPVGKWLNTDKGLCHQAQFEVAG